MVSFRHCVWRRLSCSKRKRFVAECYWDAQLWGYSIFQTTDRIGVNSYSKELDWKRWNWRPYVKMLPLPLYTSVPWNHSTPPPLRLTKWLTYVLYWLTGWLSWKESKLTMNGIRLSKHEEGNTGWLFLDRAAWQDNSLYSILWEGFLAITHTPTALHCTLGPPWHHTHPPSTCCHYCPINKGFLWLCTRLGGLCLLLTMPWNKLLQCRWCFVVVLEGFSSLQYFYYSTLQDPWEK